LGISRILVEFRQKEQALGGEMGGELSWRDAQDQMA
jgi:hypothetical protein